MRIASLTDFLLMRIERGADGRIAKTRGSAKTTASNGNAAAPLNRQIYLAIREAILSQLLPSGLQLPSSRDLAGELGISRNTVTYAYEQLIAEGYLETRPGSGTFIADTTPDQIPEARLNTLPLTDPSGQSELSAHGAQLIRQAGVSDLQWGAFMPGVPDVTLFPNKIWSRLQNKHWRRSRAELLTYGEAGGYLPLREAIAEYLRMARSVNCNASQVIITTGIHQSLDIVVKLLGEHGDSAWVEDPCYWGTRSVLNSLGIKPVAIPVDAEGMRMRLANLRQPPRFICATPSHQYPLGMVMSLSRRRMLLEYAATRKVWIIEDDYDSEFRYGSRPLASLQGMDTNDRVLYMGTFSKTMFPSLRIGFLVVPESLANAFAIGVSELYRGSQVFLQAIMADFMTEGHFASHIRRMRVLYAERLQLLQAAIERHFGDRITLTGGEAGLHLALGLPPQCDDIAISRAAREVGIVARPLSRYFMNSDTARNGLLLGYACVPNEQIGPAFDKLAAIIKMHWK
ncbi:bacterial regulatory s, gntR family protein [Collimonas arenae]|uniref:Bacterial regulatory s, gntR family protein n=1 Tax=Collimonas arenae TaxID=279058 RepID=A0A127PWY6_9BURK|nr:PLP-dependent aminotransferase family protein [Collimonas arenae]AMP02323.1 bacterial regulatory s, gntR family protein [Collimonas arenae]AMP12219.1 bacterial regulatory s, gntR family protein [Collimonas arenae]